ncbi:MAG: class I SAM-dependent methyltransferase [Chloroflexi bacterium]|nr:class I SAM-dependent methyltransferase [Chloroflexota bacterium]
MTDPDTYIQQLAESFPLREVTLRSAIQALRLPPGSHGLDAGCGIGLPTLLLAEAVGPSGYVTGLDISPTFILHAKEIVNKAGMSQRISFRQGNVEKLPFDTDTFDWIWSTDCVGYPVGELLPLLKEMIRVVKPGGIVAILAWSSQQLLPGYTMLEARLNANCSALDPYVNGVKPESHFLRALGWFHEAGLEESRAKTFAGDICAPLDDDIRIAMVSFFNMLWDEPLQKISAEDWREFQRLCKPESPDFILNYPDYYAFFTYSMFWGKVPG